MRNFLLATMVVLAFTFNASAATITIDQTTSSRLDTAFLDYGSYHLDTESGLEWLDFSNLVAGDNDPITLKHSINSADAFYSEVENGDWRLATYTEIADLFTLFFPTYDTTTSTIAVDDLNAPTSDLTEARNSWLFSFGTDATPTIDGNLSTASGDLYSLGMYVDAFGDVQIMGATVGTNPLTSTIYGPGYDVNGALDLNSAYANLGVFMVRDTDKHLCNPAIEICSPVVPIPAAFWLFGSGLIGLFVLAWRKT